MSSKLKSSMYHICIVIIPMIITLLSCKDDSFVVSDLKVEKKNGYVLVEETKVEIGQKITARMINLDSVKVYSVTLNEKKVTFNQISDSTVSLIIPYSGTGNDVGNFVFYCHMKGHYFPDSVLVSNQINYKYENWPTIPFIKWNSNQKLLEADAMKKDMLGLKGWSAITISDTIKLIRRSTCHDECGETETLVFLNKGKEVLPTFLYAIFERNELMKPRVYVKITKPSKITLDSWGDNSIYSGTFSSVDNNWVFWTRI